MAEYGTITCVNVFEGDTWDGLSLAYSGAGLGELARVEFLAVSLTNGARYLVDVEPGSDADDDTKIVFDSVVVADWQFTILAVDLAMPPGPVRFSVTTTHGGSARKTFLLGGFDVLERPSRV